MLTCSVPPQTMVQSEEVLSGQGCAKPPPEALAWEVQFDNSLREGFNSLFTEFDRLGGVGEPPKSKNFSLLKKIRKLLVFYLHHSEWMKMVHPKSNRNKIAYVVVPRKHR